MKSVNSCLNEVDFLQFFKYKQSYESRSIFFLMGSMVLVLILSALLWQAGHMHSIVYTVAFAAVAIAVWVLHDRRKLKRELADFKATREGKEFHLLLDDESITVTDQNGQREYAWATLVKVRETYTYYYFFPSNEPVIIVQKSTINDMDEQEGTQRLSGMLYTKCRDYKYNKNTDLSFTDPAFRNWGHRQRGPK